MMGVLTSDLFIQLTTTLAHLSNMTLNTAEMSLGGEIDNETLAGRRHWSISRLCRVSSDLKSWPQTWGDPIMSNDHRNSPSQYWPICEVCCDPITLSRWGDPLTLTSKLDSDGSRQTQPASGTWIAKSGQAHAVMNKMCVIIKKLNISFLRITFQFCVPELIYNTPNKKSSVTKSQGVLLLNNAPTHSMKERAWKCHKLLLIKISEDPC